MDLEQQALDECNREPIHIPGIIQRHGALIAFDAKTSEITHVSANVEEFLSGTPKDWLGQPLASINDQGIVHGMRNAAALASISERREPIGRITRNDRELELTAYRSEESFVIEIEPAEAPSWSDAQTAARISEMFQLVNRQTTLSRLMNASVRWLQKLSGFDRVMIYRFAEDASGKVVAEENVSDHGDFLGLCFPKWDIPEQARAIMKRLPLRTITDVHAEPVQLLARDAELSPLDMSVGQLRGVSAVHMEYLKNMGVKATMTLSIVVRGRLWGIISFHNYEPMVPSTRVRAICQPFIEYFNTRVAMLEDDETNIAREQVREIHREIREKHVQGSSLKDVITGDPYPVMEQFAAQGMVLRLGDEWHEFGLTLPWREIRPLVDKAREAKQVMGFEKLGEVLPEWQTPPSEIAGALVIPFDGEDCAIAFRTGIEAEVKWAGAPEKEIIQDGNQVRLSPRGSFDLFVETVQGVCPPWRPLDYELGEGLASIVLQTAQQRAQIERVFFEDRHRQQKLMISELNHRVRNILALIRSVSRQARRSNSSLSSYSAALEQRIKALAVAHDLSNDSSMKNVSLRQIIETEISPFAADGNERLSIVGADASIRPDLCPIFALVIHELTTNAVKYGALSKPEGQIEIELKGGNREFCVSWRETDGPPVVAPKRRGFGSTLIEQAIPFELDGRVQLTFAPDGLAADIWLPNEILGSTVAAAEYTSPMASYDVTPVEPRVTYDRHVLLVEDNYVIALDMESILFDLGFEKVSTASSVNKAISLINRRDFGLAILDMHLGGSENSFPIARELRSRGVPFIFATGYGSDLERPEDIAEVPYLTKPVELTALSKALDKLIGTAAVRKSA